MNVPELYALGSWIERELGGGRIAGTYTSLLQILQRNAQPNQGKQGFEQQREDLLTFLRHIELTHLSVEQIEFLNRLGITEHLGAHGVEEIEDILYRNQLDPANAATRIQQIAQQVNQGVDKAVQIKNALTGLVPDLKMPKDEALVRVSFKRDAAMNNVEDFKKWGADWHDIGRGISLIHNGSPQDVRVVGATTGSLIIELAAKYEIAMTVSGILIAGCEVVERMLDILAKVESLKGMKLKNKKLIQELEKEAEDQRIQGIEDIVTAVLRDSEKQNVDGEKREALSRAIKKLLGFVQKGGEIDCVLPEQPAQAEGADETRAAAIEKLRERFREARLTESKVRQLGIRDADESPGDAKPHR